MLPLTSPSKELEITNTPSVPLSIGRVELDVAEEASTLTKMPSSGVVVGRVALDIADEMNGPLISMPRDVALALAVLPLTSPSKSLARTIWMF